jgi:hypothetical protein
MKFTPPDQRLQKLSSKVALDNSLSQARPRGQIAPIHSSGFAPIIE